MTTYNQSTSYNRTYEKKVIEETPRIRIATHPQSTTFPSHILPTSFPSFPSPLGGHISSLHATDDSLIVTMDVAQFKGPDDLKISVIGQFIVVEGKHGEKQDEFGTIERHFIRKFNLPRNVQPEGVSSKLTSDGVLTIEAIPLKPKEGSPARAIPIKIVGSPAPAAQSTETKTEEAK
ncbi:Alpha-crystallin B chain [Trichostrongylus colubriformis]|uniref:Alpha-crystallin B chain n=1 Tax=Trichostrongylus colubriformis TaxID=6319 RepID=A0AAN8FN13_TRICO